MANTRSTVRTLLILLFLAGLFAGSLTASLMSAKAAPPQAAPPASPDLVISEFRARGPNGSSDEFVELFNPTGGTKNLNGWKINKSNDTGTIDSLYNFTSNIFLASGQHLLLANPAYGGSVRPDIFWGATDITDLGGIALLHPDNTIADQVGFGGISNITPPTPPVFLGYREGTPLTPQPLSNTDQSFERNTGGCTDTDNNIADFTLVNPSTPLNSTTISPLCTGVNTFTPTVTSTHTSTPTTTKTPTTTPTGLPTQTPNPSCGLTPTPEVYPGFALIINEVGWSGTLANSSDQWIELYNPGPCPINLNNWYIQGKISNTQQFKIYLQNTLDPADSIGAGDYFVLTTSSNVFQTNVLINQSDNRLSLLKSFSTPGESLLLVGPALELVDHANFNGDSWPAGSSSIRASMERIRANAPDIRTNWVTYAGPTTNIKDSGGNFVRGTPGRQNWAYGVTITPSPFKTPTKKPTPRPPTPFAHVVINEFLPRPGFDWNNDGLINTDDEFIEIENLGPINVSTSGWKLDNITNGGSHLYNLPSVTLISGQRALYFGSTSHIPLFDSGGTVRLINSKGIVVDARGYDPVKFADQSVCRLPDGDGYWTDPCFPTPGLENARTGTLPAAAVPANPAAPLPATPAPPCPVSDTLPSDFREAICFPFGADILNRSYWDDQAGDKNIPVQDIFNKWLTVVQ